MTGSLHVKYMRYNDVDSGKREGSELVAGTVVERRRARSEPVM